MTSKLNSKLKPLSRVWKTGALTLFASVLLVSLTATTAQASGFSCMSVDRTERMDLFFDSLEDGSQATRLMILNPNVSKRRQHVATFNAADGLLKTEGRSVEAVVDTSFPESSRKGERLGGTTLGALSMVRLEIDAQEHLFAGKTFAAQATYLKLSGEVLTQDFDCLAFDGLSAPEELAFY